MRHLTLALVLLGLLPNLAAAQDVVSQAPSKCVVRYEDETVRVIEVTLQPGDTLPFHTHPEYILYQLTDGLMQQFHRGEQPKVIELKAGTAAHRQAETEGHMARNVGNTVIRNLNIELKTGLNPAKQ